MEIDVPYSSWEGYAHSAEFATGTVMSFNARGSENKFTVAFPKRENTKPITMSWDELLGDVAWSMSTVKAVLRYPGEVARDCKAPHVTRCVTPSRVDHQTARRIRGSG